MVDYLIQHPQTRCEDGSFLVNIAVLWEVVMKGFSGVWPATRTRLQGVSLGDVWPCEALASISRAKSEHSNSEQNLDSDHLLPFHKLSQWLTYSLMEPLSLAKIKFLELEQMTGLAEYRNGGLFVDLGILKLKKPTQGIPRFEVYDDAVVEWRGLTVALLDLTADKIRARLSLDAATLTLPKILEAGNCI